MAFDKECYDRLRSLNLPCITVEFLDDFETPELLQVKPSRTIAEYCWTCGPSVIWYFIQKYSLPDITYVDSDLFFLGNPEVIVKEIGNSSVAITEQGIGEKGAKLYGRYCVQYMYFKNDEEGLNTLKWWRDSCIDWCYQRFEGDKYGDQKYLDNFPSLSPSLCVLKNPSAGIAPWNMMRYKLKGNAILQDGIEYPFIFYHMHGIVADIEGDVLALRSLHFAFNQEQLDKFLLPYAKTNMEVLNEYLGFKIYSYKAFGIGKVKALEYKIRGIFRSSKFVQLIYHKVFGITYQGHGKKVC